MLAGRVKLKHFLLGAGALALGACGFSLLSGGAVMSLLGGSSEPAPAPVAAPTASTPAQAADPAVAVGLREVDRELLGHKGTSLPVDKVKDVSPGRSWKINLYQDAGHTSVNRAKLDLDRDDKWDEKFSFALDGSVSREVAPADDEAYTRRYLLDGESWRPEGGSAVTAASPAPESPAPATPAPAVAAVAPDARDVDRVLLSYENKNLGGDKLKDVQKGKPWKLNVYQDPGASVANRAKIDLDRDDKWDEKITFKPGEISREVAPADDEVYTERYLWTGGSWTRQP